MTETQFRDFLERHWDNKDEVEMLVQEHSVVSLRQRGGRYNALSDEEIEMRAKQQRKKFAIAASLRESGLWKPGDPIGDILR